MAAGREGNVGVVFAERDRGTSSTSILSPSSGLL
jgi:hypothetical protein